MRVLFCRSNPVAPDPRVEKEARALIEAGYEVQVIAWDRSAALPLSEVRQGFQIHRLPIRAEFGHGLGNLPALLRWQLGLAIWLLRHQADYDIIHACDFDTVLPALLGKLFFRKKVIYDIFDFYADHLRATPPILKSLIRGLDLFIIGLADATILVDEARRHQISRAHSRQLIFIYNSPEETELDALQTDSPEAFRIVYVGLLQVERGLLELLEILRHHPEWLLDLAGFGGDEEQIRSRSIELPNVIWHGRIPYEETLRLSSQADVFIATYDPEIPNHRYSSPNKIFEAMMLAKPVIVAKNTNMDRIIKKWDCGLVVKYGDLDALDQALNELAGDPVLRNKLGRNGRKAYEMEFSWERMKERLHTLYRKLISEGNSWRKFS